MDLARERLGRQHLIGPPCARPEDVVANLLAVQSQDYLGAKWAVAQRTQGGADADVHNAFQEGRILRTHVLRPTWHFVTPGDIHWLLALSAPRVHAFNAYYYRKHGIDAALAKRTKARIARALANGHHLTRQELARTLGEGGGVVAQNRLACLIMLAELDGLICSGPMRGKQHTYALLEERAPSAPKLARDEALAKLARAFVRGHGPAQAHDLSWWSGLTLADAKRGLDASRGVLEVLPIGDKTYWLDPAEGAHPPVKRSVHLLPNYDELLIAFKDRSAMLDPRAPPRADVLSAHFVVIDGRIAGGWRRTLGKREVSVLAELLRPLTAVERKGLAAAAARYAQSLGLALRLELTFVE